MKIRSTSFGVPEIAARRSCLAVPASSERMLEKARELPADELAIDLEDAVIPAGKDGARAALVEQLAKGEWRAPTL